MRRRKTKQLRGETVGRGVLGAQPGKEAPSVCCVDWDGEHRRNLNSDEMGGRRATPKKPGQASHRAGKESGMMLVCLFHLVERVAQCHSKDFQAG